MNFTFPPGEQSVHSFNMCSHNHKLGTVGTELSSEVSSVTPVTASALALCAGGGARAKTTERDAKSPMGNLLTELNVSDL